MKNKNKIFIFLIFLVILVFIKISIYTYQSILESKIELKPINDMSIEELKTIKEKTEKLLFFNSFLFTPTLKIANINFALILKGENQFLDDTLKKIKFSVMLNHDGLKVKINAVLKLLFLWDKITDKDKLYCSSLFINILNVLSEKDFYKIVDVWQEHSKNISFFEKALFLKPVFFKRVAEQLINLEKYLKERWVFLSNYEIYYLSKTQKEFYGLSYSYSRRLNQNEQYLKDIIKNIRGYYVLSDNKSFNEVKYLKLLSDIYLGIINNYIEKVEMEKNNNLYINLIKYIEEFIIHTKFQGNITKLENVLEQNSFFDTNNLYTVYTKNLIHFNNKQFSKVIIKIEDILNKKNIKIKADLFEKLFYLLIDSCLAENLYIKAENFIEKFSPKLENKHRLFQQKLRVGKVLNRQTELNEIERSLLNEINQSYYFNFKGKNIDRTIYLQDKGIIFIDITKLKDIIKPRKGLLQIFINNKIKKEMYLKTFKGVINYKMLANEFQAWGVWSVKLRLIEKRSF